MPRRIPIRRFEELVAEALDDLPSEWAERIDNVVVQVEDEPSREDLEMVGLDPDDPESDLLGLYQGVPVGERGAEMFSLPDRIVVYRGPTLREARSRHEVVQVIRETVLHELGHHFGLEEDDLPF
jgi:predicted Zn-dependent protease with MMP-like domain